MSVVGPPDVTANNSRVIGIATGLNCNPDVNINMEQGDVKAVEESTEITTSKSNEYTFTQVEYFLHSEMILQMPID